MESLVHDRSKQLIRGGHQGGLATYIGRISRDSQKILGKIMYNLSNSDAAIFIATEEKEMKYSNRPFEILVYNPGTLFLSQKGN